ncbi:hypothetical protein [Rickettsia endosymbiont of Culicoides newsteadi]|nr:hypothetical protein [Rickettsia endosymbiont of Culicoides newsteadi]
MGARSDGATPINNRQALSDDVPNFSSIDYKASSRPSSLRLREDKMSL